MMTKKIAISALECLAHFLSENRTELYSGVLGAKNGFIKRALLGLERRGA